ncbi:Cobyric acid synthase [Granulosicoccus antarcticus IMCC3135]|uniref:Cobyric acid synthase n=2 Tax=Granulosicoccus TaxID=437504 RepID=A0A2Z2NUH9_9GAMM|nr:Cobyric acid synthase [Granulosicoccus antarcticus IMCC3135]
MFQGTGSDVGKSTVVAGLCRLARRRGIRVAPFKPQNMSNNAAACSDGGEIGRAQALQARACGLQPEVDFNPVLLKPQSDSTAQVVVHGKVLDTCSASHYMNDRRQHLMQAVTDSFTRLTQQYDLILVEGAGSAAEVNLRERDIANMGFAQRMQVPVCLIGDIDRGGVIASIVGTKAVISSSDADRICSFIINRFRGDPALFVDGVKVIEELTQWPCRGVIPWLPPALKLPQEDAVILEQGTQRSQRSGSDAMIRIAVPMLSRIANFDDMDPLRLEPNVELGFVPPGKPIPRDIDAIIIPGTKSAMGDLAFLQAQGWDHDIIAFARTGGKVTGVCGGYQLLGKYIHDPDGVDGAPGSAPALGLLDIVTTMYPQKQTRQVNGHCPRSQSVLSGYEIHVGATEGEATRSPMTILNGKPDGATSPDGQIEGTYLHGVFGNDDFRAWWLNNLKAGSAGSLNYESTVERELDNLADGLEAALDVDELLRDARAVES